MESTIQLQLSALETVLLEYNTAVINNAPLFVLMEIKQRLDAIRILCMADLLESYRKAS